MASGEEAKPSSGKHSGVLEALPTGRAVHDLLHAAMKADEGDIALVLLDVDNFGEINALFGAEAGDWVLNAVAELLVGAAKAGQNAQAVRVSGDEFGLLLPGLSIEQTFLRMEKLRGDWEQKSKTFLTLPEGRPLTVSIGVAQAPRDGKTVADLFKAAEAALLAAKEAGRNQVALAPTEEMVMKSCYYASGSVRRLKTLAEKENRKESVLLREALGDLLRKYDTA